jgi:hypothetical protein
VNNKVKVLTLLGMGFCLGLAAVISNYSSSRTHRDPAAFGEKLYQITNLSNSEIREQLLHRLKVHPTLEGKKTIALTGLSSSICKSYSHIELEFVAEGISVAGDPPVLTVNYPCQAAQDPSEIAPAQLAISRLTAEKPHNATFQFDGYAATFTLQNSADEWPTQWILREVEFKNENGSSKHVTFDRSPASVNEEPPVVLEF